MARPRLRFFVRKNIVTLWFQVPLRGSVATLYVGLFFFLLSKGHRFIRSASFADGDHWPD